MTHLLKALAALPEGQRLVPGTQICNHSFEGPDISGLQEPLPSLKHTYTQMHTPMHNTSKYKY